MSRLRSATYESFQGAIFKRTLMVRLAIRFKRLQAVKSRFARSVVKPCVVRSSRGNAASFRTSRQWGTIACQDDAEEDGVLAQQ
eukprot:3158768-Amphidinium_carterae.1